MTSKPLVSVIVIFLNAEKYIREAIESVIAQTYDHWQLLLVNDGSRDASTEIALRYAQDMPEQVHYIEHPGRQNRGASASRNLGIAHARGTLIALLDSDDVWLPDKLERQVAIMERCPNIGMVASRAYYWHENGLKILQPMTLSPGVLPPGSWIPKILEDDDNAACPSAIMIRRDVAVRLGGFEESFRGTGQVFEDQVMWAKATLAVPIYYDPECASLYRIHSNSLCGAIRPGEKLAARVRFYSWLTEFLKQPCYRSLNARLLRRMVRSKLCESMLQSATAPFNGRASPAIALLVRRRIAVTQSQRDTLGYLFAGVLALGAVWGRPATAVARGIFKFSRTAYNNGVLSATRSVARWLLTPIRRAVLGTAKRAIRKLARIPKVLTARTRLTTGVRPLSYLWGSDRGHPVHRYYLGQFLENHARDICGHCLEFESAAYVRNFGKERVTKIDVLHIDDSNPGATIVADLTKPNQIPDNMFDCIVCTHVLHVIFEVQKAVSELYRTLKPGGVLLVAVPHISMCDPSWHEVWRFTPEGLQKVLGTAFGQGNVSVHAYGNSLTAAGEIRGVVAHEFTQAELDYHDERFAVEVCARAVKTPC